MLASPIAEIVSVGKYCLRLLLQKPCLCYNNIFELNLNMHPYEQKGP